MDFERLPVITDGATVHGSSVILPSRVIAPLSINASLLACSSMILCGTFSGESTCNPTRQLAPAGLMHIR